jgi:hypothetical protein
MSFIAKFSILKRASSVGKIVLDLVTLKYVESSTQLFRQELMVLRAQNYLQSERITATDALKRLEVFFYYIRRGS